MENEQLSPVHPTLAFLEACSKGDVETVSILLRNPTVDPTWTLRKKFTCLVRACISGNLELVKLLLSDPRVDPNYYGGCDDFATPLMVASNLGHAHIVEALLEDERTDPNKGDSRTMTPFTEACRMGHAAVVELLVKDHRVDLRHWTGRNYITGFYHACAWKHAAVVRVLLEFVRRPYLNWEVILRDSWFSHESLAAACDQEKPRRINSIDFGFHPHMIQEPRFPHLQEQLEVVRLLLNSGSYNPNYFFRQLPPYFTWIRGSDGPSLAILKLFLEHPRFDVNTINDGTQTSLLFEACTHGSLEAVKMILALGGSRVYTGHLDAGDGPMTAAESTWNEVDSRSGLNDAEMQQYVDCAELIEAYDENPAKVTHDLRVELGYETETASMLASVIFVCDGLCDIGAHPTSPRYRFLKIACSLPLELQMLLVNRSRSLVGDLVGAQQRELAFRSLARALSPLEAGDML